METVQLVEEFKNSGVFALDIAADEAGFSLDNHFGAFDFAFENNISCTAHAGEAKGAESIKETLKKLKDFESFKTNKQRTDPRWDKLKDLI